jgi:hypothetical protein
VAAAGVAAAAQVPLISPASSSPQLSGMPFFSRTVPSDRWVRGETSPVCVLQGKGGGVHLSLHVACMSWPCGFGCPNTVLPTQPAAGCSQQVKL